MKKLLVLLFLAMAACTNEPEARRVAEYEGITNVEMTGYQFFSCSKDDWYHTGFRGTKNGHTIYGVVCSGILFKSATLRYQ